LDSRVRTSCSSAAAWRVRRWARRLAVSWRDWEREVLWESREVRRERVEVGREGMERWMKERFVEGLRRRDRDVAVEMREDEMEGVRRGRRLGRLLKGGLERRRRVDSAERLCEGVVSSGGRRMSRSSSSDGNEVVVGDGGWSWPRGRRRVGFGASEEGVEVEMAVIRRLCFVFFRRCDLSFYRRLGGSSWDVQGRAGKRCTSLTASRSFRAGSFFVEPLRFSTEVVSVL
jgi:hypothetical protein